MLQLHWPQVLGLTVGFLLSGDANRWPEALSTWVNLWSFLQMSFLLHFLESRKVKFSIVVIAALVATVFNYADDCLGLFSQGYWNSYTKQPLGVCVCVLPPMPPSTLWVSLNIGHLSRPPIWESEAHQGISPPAHLLLQAAVIVLAKAPKFYRNTLGALGWGGEQ